MTDSAIRVAALYVETNGVYYGLDDVDPWDEARDARLYAGPWPVVAHPPCKTWSRLGTCRPEIVRGDDGGCFAAALEAVETFGGVLEHPAYSFAWSHFGLPRPPRYGWSQSFTRPGYACEVDQAHYGHEANKRTWLYFVGPPPAAPRWDAAPFTGLRVQDAGSGSNPARRSRTPPAFRDVLLDMARSARRETCS